MQKLHLICGDPDGFRPILDYIFISKDEIWACNSFAGVIHKTEDLFNKEFSASLGESKYLIHKNDWKELCKGKAKYILADNKLEVWRRDKVQYISLYSQEDKGYYPNLPRVIPDKESATMGANVLSIDPILLHNLQLAIYPYTPTKTRRLNLILKLAKHEIM